MLFHTQYKTSKEGSTMGVTVSHSAMLTHCHTLTQACGYTEGEGDTHVSHTRQKQNSFNDIYIRFG